MGDTRLAGGGVPGDECVQDLSGNRVAFLSLTPITDNPCTHPRENERLVDLSQGPVMCRLVYFLYCAGGSERPFEKSF